MVAKTVDPGSTATPYTSVLLEWNQSTEFGSGFL